jgi:Sec-independent protein secretion pathway component TatC
VTFRTQRPGALPARRVLAFRRMVIALSSVAASLGLIFVFFVVFPVLVQGLIAFAIAQVMGERAENQAYMARRRACRE